MTVANNLFFGTSIQKSQHTIIRQQLEENSLKDEVYWIIIFMDQGPNLLECISMEAFKRLSKSLKTYTLVGVVGDKDEFPLVVLEIINTLLVRQYPISKKSIRNLLQGEYNE